MGDPKTVEKQPDLIHESFSHTKLLSHQRSETSTTRKTTEGIRKKIQLYTRFSEFEN